MPLRRNPPTLLWLSGANAAFHFWTIVNKLFGFASQLTFEDFVSTEKGQQFFNYLFQRGFQQNDILRLPHEAFDDSIDCSYLRYGSDVLFVLCFRPKKLTLNASVHSCLWQMLLEKNDFTYVEEFVLGKDVVQLPPCFFQNTLKTLSNLVSVEGQLDDGLLVQLSENCPKIRSVFTTANITDVGIAALEKLHELESAIVTQQVTNITVAAVVSLLRKATRLKVLDTDVCHLYALGEIYVAQLVNKNDRDPPFTCNLRNIICNCAWEDETKPCIQWYLQNRPAENLVSMAIRACPFLTDIHIRNNLVGDEELQAVLLVQFLTDLSVTNEPSIWNNYGVTFQRGILPILLKQGKQLKKLRLDSVEAVNIEAIAYCCPKLQILTLIRTTSSNEWPESLPPVSSPPLLTSLESLFIDPLEPVLPDEDHLVHWYTLFTDTIEDVSVYYSNLLNDALVEKILQKTGLPNLSSLNLTRCSNISVVSLWRILSPENQLFTLIFNPGETENLLTHAETTALEAYCENFSMVCNFRSESAHKFGY